MAKAYDIPADDLIMKLAEQLKKDKKIESPSWAAFVKTGAHRTKTGGIQDVPLF
jgi:small subunit ribosomal protein S19e